MKPARTESDDGLMARAQGDDSEAFAELYDRHANHAFAVARSVCRDVSRAEEAVQEGFLSIWRGRASYEPRSGSSFSGWAMQTVRNRAIDSQRHMQTARHPPTTELPDADIDAAVTNDPHDEVADRDEGAALRVLLRRLPDAQAEVITLAFFGEMSHSEIAAQLGLRPGTVKGRMRLGLERLREAMEAP